MIYNEVCGEKLSALGMGTLRLPTINNKDEEIDVEKTKQMIDLALNKGINYFDTAFGYHGGNAERVVGKILSEYDRDTYYLATKFPGFRVETMNSPQEIFEKQLEKCCVSYFDFYLLHNVSEGNVDLYLSEDNHVIEYFLQQKELGRIRHLGFSTHGGLPVMQRFLERYADCMEFCQIQLNYLDLSYQHAKEKCELIKKYHLPIWVMEPVRGGSLATTTEEWERKLKSYRPDESVAAWAFRFLQTIPEVKMVLSGMSNMEQVEENIKIYSEYKPLSKEETDVILSMAEERIKNNSLPCTACKYCMEVCPKGIEIPSIFRWYNKNAAAGGYFIAPYSIVNKDKQKSSENCIACKKCESVCPQNIKISEIFSEMKTRIEWR